MIQRKQTLWLLFATIAAFLTIKFPFYTGNILENNLKVYKTVDARYNIGIVVLTVSIAIIALVTIFLYADRKKQMLFSAVNLLLSLITIFLYHLQTKLFVDGAYSITAILSIVLPFFIAMAIIGMYSDEKLIKNADRLR